MCGVMRLTYRPFGTAAQYTVVPLAQAVPLPETVPVEQGACLGIPGITAHRAAISQALEAGWQGHTGGGKD